MTMRNGLQAAALAAALSLLGCGDAGEVSQVDLGDDATDAAGDSARDSSGDARADALGDTADAHDEDRGHDLPEEDAGGVDAGDVADADDSDGDGGHLDVGDATEGGDTEHDGDGSFDALVDAPPEPIAISGFFPIENPENVLSYFAEWRTDRPATTGLHVTCDDGYDQTWHGSELRTEHAVFVMGLVAGATCTFDATAEAPGASGTASAVIEGVGPLPAALPELTVSTLDSARIQPGWTVWTLAREDTTGSLVVALIDENGDYRWYDLVGDVSGRQRAIDAHVVDGGVLLGGRDPGPRPYLIGWEGEFIWEGPPGNHHDIRPSPFNEDHYLFLDHSSEGCPLGRNEGRVNELNIATGEVIWSWAICHYYTPPVAFPDWTHANAIGPVPGERAVLLSLRNQDNVLKVNRDTNELEWVLGGNGDFEMDPEDRFLRQHAAEALENGNVVLFDNGAEGQRTYSRALEIALTFDEEGEPDRADVVWDYTDVTLYSSHKSDANRLANGNTLIAYSHLRDSLDAVILEVTAEREVIWDLRTPPGWWTYRAERVDPYWGHTVE